MEEAGDRYFALFLVQFGGFFVVSLNLVLAGKWSDCSDGSVSEKHGSKNEFERIFEERGLSPV